MIRLLSHYRVAVCVVLLSAFLFPVFRGLTAFDFIQLAIKETKANSEITLLDLVIVLTPLLAIPVTAIAIIFRSKRGIKTRKTVLFLPLVCFVFFFVVFLFGTNRQLDQLLSMSFLSKLGFGFYLGTLSSILLPFTPKPEEKQASATANKEKNVVLVN